MRRESRPSRDHVFGQVASNFRKRHFKCTCNHLAILSAATEPPLRKHTEKTAFPFIGTKQRRLKFSDLTNLSLSNDIIPVSSSVVNRGFIFDSDMSFSDRINSVSKSCHFHIRNIRHSSCKFPFHHLTSGDKYVSYPTKLQGEL